MIISNRSDSYVYGSIFYILFYLYIASVSHSFCDWNFYLPGLFEHLTNHVDAFFIQVEKRDKMKYGLIGNKLGHSFSKTIHELLASYTYELCPLTEAEFHRFMKQRDFSAINVTIPYKIAVISYLDEMDEKACKIGAVNTILHQNGRLMGTNTDYDGFRYTLNQHHINVYNKKVLVLGDGGGAQAIKAVLKDEGCKQIISTRRTASPTTISYEEARQRHRDVQIIVNTTPCGMYPDNDECPCDLADFPACEAVVDIIYNPLLTRLCLQARQRGIRYAGGLEMLIAQAKYAVEFFTRKAISDHRIDEIYHQMIKEKRNIVLIGMPSCGKTTIARLLGEQLGRNWIDLDEAIKTQTHRSIADIINQDGEAAFREIESSVCAQLAKSQNIIISTGGGIVKNPQNMERLACNGWIVYVKRDLDLLLVDKARPLSSSKNAIAALYEERRHLYEGYSDVIIENDRDINTAVTQILQAYEALDKKEGEPL